MATVLNLTFVPSRISVNTIDTNVPFSTNIPRIAVAPFPLNVGGAGAPADPIGPQRWPVKL